MRTPQANGATPILPFLKWAGGKRWLVAARPDLFPRGYKRYIEPFLGGGAVFFALRPTKALIADANHQLIATYQAIGLEWQSVFRRLQHHQKKHNDAYYYRLRAAVPTSAADAAAQFIYLNRTCWNGLYRVNLRGEFNVPRGTKSAVIFESDDFATIAQSLAGVRIRCCDFAETLREARSGDFIFVDPPYTAKHNSNGFLKYNGKVFSWQDQIRLREAIGRASNRGATILMLNAWHHSITSLYAGLGRFETLERHSVLAADSKHRAKVEELAILINYQE